MIIIQLDLRLFKISMEKYVENLDFLRPHNENVDLRLLRLFKTLVNTLLRSQM